MEWTTVAAVKAYLGLPLTDAGDDLALDGVVAAVNSWLDGHAAAVGGLTEPDVTLSEMVPTRAAMLGADTYAARLFTTRAYPAGVVGSSDLGGASYVSRYLDVQTQQLLRLGASTPGRVG